MRGSKRRGEKGQHLLSTLSLTSPTTIYFLLHSCTSSSRKEGSGTAHDTGAHMLPLRLATHFLEFKVDADAPHVPLCRLSAFYYLHLDGRVCRVPHKVCDCPVSCGLWHAQPSLLCKLEVRSLLVKERGLVRVARNRSHSVSFAVKPVDDGVPFDPICLCKAIQALLKASDAVPHVAARGQQQNASVDVMLWLPDAQGERLVAAVVRDRQRVGHGW
jgi:hypothetical protein